MACAEVSDGYCQGATGSSKQPSPANGILRTSQQPGTASGGNRALPFFVLVIPRWYTSNSQAAFRHTVVDACAFAGACHYAANVCILFAG